jgi:hypothetical protein
LAAVATYPYLLHTVASPEATKERAVDDRGQVPDGYNHVGNGSLTRQTDRTIGINGSDPALEDAVSSWRRRSNGLPPEDDTGSHGSPIARGRAEVPGGAYAADPAEVNPVTPNPPIPQQPGPPETTHHFPSTYPPVPGDERPAFPPARRPERHYDERIRYQRPFRFRQRQDDRHGTTGRAEAQFGPAEFGPPEYSPPNYGPVDHRLAGPRAPEFGGPPRSPAPWGAADAPGPYESAMYGDAPDHPGTNGTGTAPSGFAWTPPERWGSADGAPPVASAAAAPPAAPPVPIPEPPPVVPAPLIPPPAPDAGWAGGTWTDATWSAGPAPAVAPPEDPPAPPIPQVPADPSIPASEPVSPARPAPHGSQLPQRIPAEPDVPAVPGADGPEGTAETPDIARIADYLRDEELAEARRDGFDFPAVIEAVRGVVGVRDAELVTVDGSHTLRLDLADDADPGEVSRAVARLLKEQMGVSAEPSQQVPAAPTEEPTEVPTEVPADEPTAVLPAPAVEPGKAPAEADDAADPGLDKAPDEPVAGPQPEAPLADDLAEPPELVPVIEPLPARLADLPRVGEAPAAADGVRVAAVPCDEVKARVRPSSRSLEALLAAVDPPTSFDEWLETVRPGAVRNGDEHASLVGMPTVPVFHDPLVTEPEPEPVTQSVTHPAEEPVDAEATTDAEPVAGPLVLAPGAPAVQVAGTGGRVRLEEVEVANDGLDAVVRVRLSAGDAQAVGSATGPAVDQYVQRLCATAAGAALDVLLTDTETGVAGGRCYVEQAAVVPLGTCEVAVVVLLLTSGGWVEQLTGSAMVAGDARQAIVRATLAAANRRLDALLP